MPLAILHRDDSVLKVNDPVLVQIRSGCDPAEGLLRFAIAAISSIDPHLGKALLLSNSEQRQKLTRSYPISHKKNAKLAKATMPKRMEGRRLTVRIELVNKNLPASTNNSSFSALLLSSYLKIRNSGLESKTLSLS